MDAAALSRVLTPAPPLKPSAVKRLAELEAAVPGAADLILLGDSLAAAWPQHLYREAFPGRGVFNYGLPGDRVQTTLWRLDRMPAAHLRPDELVLLLGTNNLGDGDPLDAIAAGIKTVLARALALWGASRAIVVTVPRRGDPPGFRERDRLALNRTLAHGLAATGGVTILNADVALASSPGEEPSLLPDLLHLSEPGYARLSRAAGRLLGGRWSQSAGVSVQATEAASPGFASDEKR